MTDWGWGEGGGHFRSNQFDVIYECSRSSYFEYSKLRKNLRICTSSFVNMALDLLLLWLGLLKHDKQCSCLKIKQRCILCGKFHTPPPVNGASQGKYVLPKSHKLAVFLRKKQAYKNSSGSQSCKLHYFSHRCLNFNTFCFASPAKIGVKVYHMIKFFESIF